MPPLKTNKSLGDIVKSYQGLIREIQCDPVDIDMWRIRITLNEFDDAKVTYTDIFGNVFNAITENPFKVIERHVSDTTITHIGWEGIIDDMINNNFILDAVQIANIAKASPYTSSSGNHSKYIKNVIFNDPATIVFWSDGSKTVVKAHNEFFDPEKGLAMAIAKKFFGNEGNYYNHLKKWLPCEVDVDCDSCKKKDSCRLKITITPMCKKEKKK